MGPTETGRAGAAAACTLAFAGLTAATIRGRGLGVGAAVGATVGATVAMATTLGVGADTGAGTGSSEIEADCAMT